MTATIRDFGRRPTTREEVCLSCSWAMARRVPACHCCFAHRHAIVSQSRWRELDAFSVRDDPSSKRLTCRMNLKSKLTGICSTSSLITLGTGSLSTPSSE